jgi:hypothetical protein
MKGVSRASHVKEVIEQVGAIQHRLLMFEQCLPSHLKLTFQNVYFHPGKSSKITFIMLLSWWFECHCDLYRFVLPGFRESVDFSAQDANFVKDCYKKVLEAASAQSDLWKSVMQMGYVLISDPLTAVLVHSNTMTLLAAQKAIAANHNEQCTVQTLELMATTSARFASMVASNLSFLDELAKRLPKVAAAVSQAPRTFHYCS